MFTYCDKLSLNHRIVMPKISVHTVSAIVFKNFLLIFYIFIVYNLHFIFGFWFFFSFHIKLLPKIFMVVIMSLWLVICSGVYKLCSCYICKILNLQFGSLVKDNLNVKSIYLCFFMLIRCYKQKGSRLKCKFYCFSKFCNFWQIHRRCFKYICLLCF